MTTSTRLNILNSKRYLNKFSDLKYKPDCNNNFYLASFPKSVGLYILKKIFNVKSKNPFENFLYIISDIYFGINYSIQIIKKKISKIFFPGLF